MLMYALERRSAAFVLAFAGGCVLSSAYGFLAGTWPFGVVEIVWALVAVNRYRSLRAGLRPPTPAQPLAATRARLPRRILGMEPLRMAAPLCSLSDPELREQLARYPSCRRICGSPGVERVIRVTRSVPGPLVEKLVQVERQCCPFFQLSWDGPSRYLLISVSATGQAPALDAVTYALGARAAGPRFGPQD